MENQSDKNNIEKKDNLNEKRIGILDSYMERLLGTIKVDPKLTSSRNRERMVYDAESLVNSSSFEKPEGESMNIKLIQLLRKSVKRVMTLPLKLEDKPHNPYEYLDNLLSQIIIEKASLEGNKIYDDLYPEEKESFIEEILNTLGSFDSEKQDDQNLTNKEKGDNFENILNQLIRSGSIDISTVIRRGLLDGAKHLAEKKDFLTEYLEDKIQKPLELKIITGQIIDWSKEINKLKDPRISFSTLKDVLSTALSVNLVYPEEISNFLNLNESIANRARNLAILIQRRKQISIQKPTK